MNITSWQIAVPYKLMIFDWIMLKISERLRLYDYFTIFPENTSQNFLLMSIIASLLYFRGWGPKKRANNRICLNNGQTTNYAYAKVFQVWVTTIPRIQTSLSSRSHTIAFLRESSWLRGSLTYLWLPPSLQRKPYVFLVVTSQSVVLRRVSLWGDSSKCCFSPRTHVLDASAGKILK